MTTPKLLIFDLDGTVYRGTEPVPYAAETIRAARAAGVRAMFATNRASRSEEAVARQLRSMGVPCRRADVVTTATATAAYIAANGGGSVYAVGLKGLKDALSAHGLPEAKEGPADWVVVSWDTGLTYAKLARATSLVLGGARFVATNPDPRLNMDCGLLPGAGAIVAAVSVATGKQPLVIGKPAPTLFAEAMRRAGVSPEDTVAVGDLPQTDIAAARAAGVRSCLLLTGVATRADAEASPHRPDAICENWRELAALLGLGRHHGQASQI